MDEARSSRQRVDDLLRGHGFGAGHGVVEALEGLCRCATEDLALLGAAATLMPTLGTNTVSASTAVARQLEEAQFGLGEGPSRDAFAARRPVLLPSLVDGALARWPGWIPVALDSGVFAAYALPLHVGATMFGALTLYTGPRGLDGEGLETAFVFSEVATEVLLDRGTGRGPDLAPDLSAALDTHAHVYQAQGMVMVDLGVTLAEALARMRAHAWATDEDLTTLAGDFDLLEFLHNLTERAAAVSGAAAVGLVLSDHQGRVRFMASSNESGKMLELLQLQNAEGPCLDCVTTGSPVVNAGLGHAGDRWPVFAVAARDAGFQSVHAFPLRLRSTVIGALGLFGAEDSRFDEEEVRVVQALADVATIAILHECQLVVAETLTEQLQSALNSRIVIEQAKGALAQADHITTTEAFDLLRSRARSTRKRMVDVAQEVLVDLEARGGG